MSTATSTRPRDRQPKGIPAGGQFAVSAHSEAGISLADPDAEPQRAYADAPPVFTAKYDNIDEKLAAFKAELDGAVGDLAYDDNWLRYLETQSKFHRYSFANQMLIALQTQGRATKVAGFRAWQEKFGRTVNKGEKSIGILAPKMAWVAKKDSDGEVVKGKDGKPIKEKRVVGFTTASVFDVAQTSGPDLPTIEEELSETPPAGFVEDMEAAAKEAGYKVEYRELDSHATGRPQGFTSPASKTIVVDASLSDGSQAATLAHELGHVYAGHCDNLDDYHTGDGGCRGRFEVEAESVAYSLTRANGMSMDGSKLAAQYVAGWSAHDRDALRESAETVAKATKKVLEAVPFRNAIDD